ncbi:hypothetical protein Tco_1079458 [Tanacetum coccineum]|uniref:Uncharacterized protein n=1 Tax=Tanacetum coccineum TaxID=301880 RepID=A0ABQ5HS70_9ASTR
MMVLIPMNFSSANSTKYLVSTIDGTVSLKGLILAEPDVIQARGLWEAPGSVGFVHQSFSRTNGVQSQPLSQPFYIDYSTNVATPIQHAVNGQSVRRRLLSKDTKESAFVNIEGFSQPLVGKPIVSERFQQQSLVSPLTAGNVSITEAHEGNSKCEVLSSVLFLSDVLIRAFISGCSYESISSRKSRSLAKELVTGAFSYGKIGALGITTGDFQL